MTEIAYCPSQLVSNCNGNNNNIGNGLDSRFSWIPCGLSPSMIEQYFKEHFVPSQIPYRDSEGAEFWDELFHYQYPKQDIGLSYCSFVNPEYRRLYQLLLEDRNRHALDIARTEIVTESDLTCSRCNGTITKSSVAVVAQMYLNSLSTELSTESPHSDSTTSSSISSSVASSPPAVPTLTISTTTNTTTNSHTTTPNKQPQHPPQQQHHFTPNNLFEAFHPECFRCVTCEQPLAYYIYCVFHRQLYCERHYLEKLRPRCAACSELIFSPLFLRELSQHWHMEHFACHSCAAPLAGTRYVVHEDHPHCVQCFEQQHSNVCDECQKPIGINCKDLSYKERHWHEACFVCHECKKSLLQQPFGSKLERIYCGECYDQLFGTRCDKCTEVFRPGQRKLEYKGKQWHEQCFVCTKCMIPIGTKSFVPKNEDIYCSECYENKFATRCVKCCEIIMNNGVMFKDEPWHKECFTCNECRVELAGSSFLVREDKAYCRDCFSNKFSHKCAVCTKAIIGTNHQSTRFISFEELYWHTECFACVDCKTRLEGRGFIRDGPDIICGDCAKIKLQAEIEAV